jgi:hypothetical protein
MKIKSIKKLTLVLVLGIASTKLSASLDPGSGCGSYASESTCPEDLPINCAYSDNTPNGNPTCLEYSTTCNVFCCSTTANTSCDPEPSLNPPQPVVISLYFTQSFGFCVYGINQCEWNTTVSGALELHTKVTVVQTDNCPQG